MAQASWLALGIIVVAKIVMIGQDDGLHAVVDLLSSSLILAERQGVPLGRCKFFRRRVCNFMLLCFCFVATLFVLGY